MNEDLSTRLDRIGEAEGPRALARFLWLDHESGDELAVEVHGSESFFNELENIGFERLDDPLQERPRTPRRSDNPRLNAKVDVASASSSRRFWNGRVGA